MVKNTLGQSDLRTFKSSTTEEWQDQSAWFLACWILIFKIFESFYLSGFKCTLCQSDCIIIETAISQD